MIDIETIKNNVSKLSKKIPSLNIDSIFLEQDGKLDKVFYNEECLHELRSCSKLLVAMAIGIAIEKGMITLDTLIYSSIKDIVDIRNENNLDKINCKEFILNVSKSSIEKDDKEIELTKNELRILKFLVENREKIVSREDIMECLWDSESFIDDNTLTVNITRLRNKLEMLELKELLETKRGQGYILKRSEN